VCCLYIKKDNEGLYTLMVIKAEDEDEFGYWQDHVFAGIKIGLQ
jgi:hypothetical protein